MVDWFIGQMDLMDKSLLAYLTILPVNYLTKHQTRSFPSPDCSGFGFFLEIKPKNQLNSMNPIICGFISKPSAIRM
jgi:hypothetical protein